MMQFTFYVFFLLTRLFGLLPFWALHLLSNMCYFLFYYLIPYRKKVIRQNIQRSFPGLSKKAQTTIVKGFYRNFCDILIEGIRGFSISKKQLLKRYVFTNPEVMNELYEKGHDVVAVGAHYANWEWGIIAAPLQLKHKLYALYTPLSNTPMDGYLRGNRKKWGTELVPSREVKKVFDAQHDTPVMYFFGADQSPANPKGAHWMKFLNQNTACMKGPEFFARRYRLPVVYFDVRRVKKGYYTVTLSVLETDAINTESGEITERYMHTLEKLILQKPEDYLWSHRRWKHTMKKSETV
jgi:KDO2-lipid IV(A) lauroyltransferase